MTPPRRPVYLNLFRIHLPVMAWVSILHRVSGALLALAFPLAVWALAVSLADEAGYARLAATFDFVPAKLVVLGLVWALTHHYFAGLRHLALDLHWGLARAQARRISFAVLGLTAFVTVVAAWRLFV